MHTSPGSSPLGSPYLDLDQYITRGKLKDLIKAVLHK
jgi:hypothetical protein